MGGARDRLAQSLAALRGVFANPALRRVEIAYFGGAIGTYSFSLTLALYAYHQGGATAVGVVTAVRQALAAVVAPLAASFADRFPRRRVMLASDVSRVVLVGGAGALASAGAPQLSVYAIAVAAGLFGVVFRPAEAALLPSLAASPAELTAANVASRTFDSIGIFAGPALGAFAYAAGGATTAFLVVAGTFLWSALNVARIPAPPRAEDVPVSAAAEEAGEATAGLAAGFRAIAAEPRLRLLLGLYAAQCAVAGALGVLVVTTALKLLSLGNGAVGLFQSACGIGAIVGAGVSLALVGRGRLAGDLGVGLVLFGLPLAVIGAAPHAAVAAIGLGVLGIGNTMVDVSALTLMQRAAPVEVAGRIFGVVEGVLVGSLALGAVVAPALIAAVGVRWTLVAYGSFLPVVTVVCWRLLARVDDGARVPAEQIAALRGVPFLSVLPLQTLEYLGTRLARVELPAGARLFAAGDEGDRFYVLTDGSLAVELPAGEKREHAPAFVGEIALLRDIPRTAGVRATEDSVLWALDRRDFLDALTGHARARSGAEDVAGARLGTAAAG